MHEEARLREEAAGELGKLLIECGAETIEPAQAAPARPRDR